MWDFMKHNQTSSAHGQAVGKRPKHDSWNRDHSEDRYFLVPPLVETITVSSISSVSSVIRPEIFRANSRLLDEPVSSVNESDNSSTRLPMASVASFLAFARGCETERI